MFRDLFITDCSFICFYELLHHRFFQYLNDFNISISHRFFCFEEFPSILRSIDYLLDNKQIDFTCFFRILPSKSCMPLKFVTNKLHINCFCLNPSDEITSMNGIALRRKFNILSIWYALP